MDTLIQTMLQQVPNIAVAVFVVIRLFGLIDTLLANQKELIERLSQRPATSIETMPATAKKGEGANNGKLP